MPPVSNIRKKQKVQAEQKSSNINDSIVLNISPGKTFIDGRNVTQHKQKGETCWYYSFNKIRPRIGSELGAKLNKLNKKNLDLSYKEDEALKNLIKYRKYEKLISDYRKSISNIDLENMPSSMLSDVIKMDHNLNHESKKTIVTKKDIKEFMSITNQFSGILKEITTKKNLENIKRFLKQDSIQDFEVFCDSLMHQQIVYLADKFIDSIGFQDKFQDELLGRELSKENFLALNNNIQYAVVNSFIRKLAADCYKLKYLQWCPQDGVSLLKASLKKHGPMLFNGLYGSGFYSSKPIHAKTTKKNKYDIYFWKKGSARKNIKGVAHSILVIGIESNKVKAANGVMKLQNTVLFTDPNYESNPSQPIKVFRMSYDNFIKRMCNLNGVPISSARGVAIRGPFSYHTNHEENKKIQSNYQVIAKQL